MSNEQFGFRGPASATSGGADYNAQMFVIGQVLAGVSTAKLVQIVSVTNAGDLSPVGFVDVQPLVNQLDGYDNAVEHGVVHNLPYFRLQGGTDAVILDPKQGDVGVAIFCDRDISAVKSSRAQANPGSKRRFDMADGLYIGGFLNGTPQQYVRFSSAGIAVVSPTKVTLQAPLVEVDASTSFTVNSPQSGFSGTVIVQGLLSWLAGMTGSVVSGVASLITGAVQFVGTITSNGHAIDSTHQHTNSGGSGLGGPPQ
ncbi:Gp138 family membrane-puncturing spike protein [Paraburkholderia caribensis]|uniref:Gp138 family membrane-puncturing spike protein n=1 Tax=Paraburkholderia caribensis TaxID=75105 RepID=UPI001D072CA3|nr:Gp138 family membrane-puncturing spike protein [Paraburkholderia caribensis]